MFVTDFQIVKELIGTLFMHQFYRVSFRYLFRRADCFLSYPSISGIETL
jgi:hypothetical protein